MPPRSKHVHPGDVSRALIQQGEGEVGEDSVQQQHDGVVVVEEHGTPAGLRQAHAEEGRCWGGEGLRLGCGAAALPPPLYL